MPVLFTNLQLKFEGRQDHFNLFQDPSLFHLSMPRLFKKSHRYNVARNCFVAKVILLDNTTIEFNLLPEVTGADCLEKVAQVVEIQEVSLLGGIEELL